MKQYLQIIFCACLSMAISTASGQLYSYTNNTSGAYSSVAANTTGAALSLVNGATAPASPCGSGFSATSFSTTTTYASTLGAVEAQVTAGTGYQLSVTGFSVGLRRSGQGPESVRLAYSTDGGANWTNKGTNDAPNNGNCGTVTTVTWTAAITVGPNTPLKFRIYAFNANNITGTLQVLNLAINGTVTSSNTITTSTATFGPFCENTSNTVSVPFTTVGTFTGQYYVQLSDAAGVFPANATANLISTGTSTSPATATIQASTAAGTGYRVRVVNQAPAYYASGDNGSNIVINPTVVPAVTIVDSPATSCAGGAVRFSVATVSGGGANPTYQWYVNGVASGTGAIYSSSVLANNDSVYLALTSNALCASPATVSSNVIKVTVYPIRATALADTLCPGDSLIFAGVTHYVSGSFTANLQTVNGCDSAVTLNLFVRNLLRDTITANICQGDVYAFHGANYAVAGFYSDTASCSNIGTVRLIVNTRPTAVATLTGTAQLSTTAFANYQWLRNGAVVSGGNSQNFIASQDGSYSVAVVDANGCKDTSNVIAITLIGITETSTLPASIYPNPTEGNITIDANTLVSIEVVDMIGRTIVTTEISKGQTHVQMDISTFAKGIYTLILHGTENKVAIKNIVRQ